MEKWKWLQNPRKIKYRKTLHHKINHYQSNGVQVRQRASKSIHSILEVLPTHINWIHKPASTANQRQLCFPIWIKFLPAHNKYQLHWTTAIWQRRWRLNMYITPVKVQPTSHQPKVDTFSCRSERCYIPFNLPPSMGPQVCSEMCGVGLLTKKQMCSNGVTKQWNVKKFNISCFTDNKWNVDGACSTELMALPAGQ